MCACVVPSVRNVFNGLTAAGTKHDKLDNTGGHKGQVSSIDFAVDDLIEILFWSLKAGYCKDRFF
jgi:hypothetical protein